MDWNAVQAWGERVTKDVSAAADLASSKMMEVAEHAKVRISAPIQVGPYKVSKIKKLAEGGFSEVFLAQDVNSDDQFALKRMVCQTPSAKADAKAELKLLKSFGKHPNIITVLGAKASSLNVPGQRREAMEVRRVSVRPR